MLCKSASDEVDKIKVTLQELDISTEEAISIGLLTFREETLLRWSELQKTNPIDHGLVFG
jgi:hypothetical protein